MIGVDSYFVWNGVNSREFDIVVERQPDIVRAEKEVSEIKVPGRGKLFIDEGAFANVTKKAECGLFSARYIDEIATWLAGAGRVVFSNEKDKAYDAFVKNAVAFSDVWGLGLKKFVVMFDCCPLKRSVCEADEGFVMFAPGSFAGRGTWKALPRITVYGAGDISLSVNGGEVRLAGVDGHVVLDSEVMECFKVVPERNPDANGAGGIREADVLNSESRNMFMIGEFPELRTGENDVSWSGKVERVEVLPRWRWV